MVSSATMKRLWADPEWKARQLERIAEGWAAPHCKGRDGRKVQDGHAIGKQVQLACRFDPDVFESLRYLARKQNKSVAEIIRTYVDWGLEQEKTL